MNKKHRIRSHLKKCENFKLVVGEQNINQILEEEERIVINSQRRTCIIESNIINLLWMNSSEQEVNLCPIYYIR